MIPPNVDPSLFGPQMQASDARNAIAKQMAQSAMAQSQSNPFGGISNALLSNYLTGQANQQAAQAKLVGPQNAFQLPGTPA